MVDLAKLYADVATVKAEVDRVMPVLSVVIPAPVLKAQASWVMDAKDGECPVTKSS